MDQTHAEVTADASKRGLARETDQPAGAAGGALTVRTERRADRSVIWLSGALDKATSGLLDREFDKQAGHATHVVVDVTGVERIDFSGLDTLVRTQRRAWENNQRTSFRYGPCVGALPQELSDNADRRFRSMASRSEREDQRHLLRARHGVR